MVAGERTRKKERETRALRPKGFVMDLCSQSDPPFAKTAKDGAPKRIVDAAVMPGLERHELQLASERPRTRLLSVFITRTAMPFFRSESPGSAIISLSCRPLMTS